MNSDLNDFKQFMTKRERAADSYVQGDSWPLDQLVTHTSPATFFGPDGSSHEGAEHVLELYDEGATHFEPVGKSHFEVLQMGASDGIAFWVGIQRAYTKIREKKKAGPQNLRITEIYRREDGSWKLIHRHADSLHEGDKH